MPAERGTEPDLDDLADLQWVLECAERTPAGLSFYPPDDLVMRESAEALAPQQGHLVIDLHGTTDRAKVGSRWLGAGELATVLRACDEWDGRPIFLMCCDSGRKPDGFAQQLADRLQTQVTAPDRLAWSDFDAGGRAQPYSSDGFLDTYGLPRPVKPPTGTFVTFAPRDLDTRSGSPREKGIAASTSPTDVASRRVPAGTHRVPSAAVSASTARSSPGLRRLGPGQTRGSSPGR